MQAYVDTRKGFQAGQSIKGSVSLDRMPRLREMLANEDGEVTADMEFRVTDRGQQVVQGQVKAMLTVSCQRCLEPLVIDLVDDINLAVVRDLDAAGRLAPEWDPWLVVDHKLELAPMIEEQLMLCMPLVSYHTQPCIAARAYQAGKTDEAGEAEIDGGDNPFAVLKSLKDND